MAAFIGGAGLGRGCMRVPSSRAERRPVRGPRGRYRGATPSARSAALLGTAILGAVFTNRPISELDARSASAGSGAGPHRVDSTREPWRPFRARCTRPTSTAPPTQSSNGLPPAAAISGGGLRATWLDPRGPAATDAARGSRCPRGAVDAPKLSHRGPVRRRWPRALLVPTLELLHGAGCGAWGWGRGRRATRGRTGRVAEVVRLGDGIIDNRPRRRG